MSKRRSRSPAEARRRRYSRSRSDSEDFHRRGRGRARSDSSSDSRSPRYRSSVSRSSIKMRRRQSEDRENPRPSTCIGIFGLSLKTEEKDLYRVFQKYGEIKDVQLVLDNYTGRSRGFGFVYYDDVKSAINAKEAAHGSEIDGRPIRVDFSITRKAHTPTPGIYLGRKSDRHGDYGYGGYEEKDNKERYSRSSTSDDRRRYRSRRSNSYNRRK